MNIVFSKTLVYSNLTTLLWVPKGRKLKACSSDGCSQSWVSFWINYSCKSHNPQHSGWPHTFSVDAVSFSYKAKYRLSECRKKLKETRARHASFSLVAWVTSLCLRIRDKCWEKNPGTMRSEKKTSLPWRWAFKIFICLLLIFQGFTTTCLGVDIFLLLGIHVSSVLWYTVSQFLAHYQPLFLSMVTLPHPYTILFKISCLSSMSLNLFFTIFFSFSESSPHHFLAGQLCSCSRVFALVFALSRMTFFQIFSWIITFFKYLLKLISSEITSPNLI